MNKKTRNWLIVIVLVIVVAAVAYFSFIKGHQSESKKDVTIGIMTGDKADDKIWQSVKQTAKDKYGVTVHFKKFTDYSQPNKALAQHDVDLDAFQHYAFLNDWNKKNHSHIVAIGETTISPIKVYSKKFKSISELPKGATIAIPNDASNEGRALLVLKNAGLIKPKAGKQLATIADIGENKKDLKIKEVDASQTAHALNDVDAAIVNNTFATTAHLSNKDAIYTEPLNKDSKQWVNVIAADKDDKNNKYYKDVVKAYQTKKTADLIKKYYGTATVPAWNKDFK